MLSPDRAASVLEMAIMHSAAPLREGAERFISRHFDECLDFRDFCCLPADVLAALFARRDATYTLVFRHVMLRH